MTAEPAPVDYATVFPAGAGAMVGLQRAVDTAVLEPQQAQPLMQDFTRIAQAGAPAAVYHEALVERVGRPRADTPPGTATNRE